MVRSLVLDEHCQLLSAGLQLQLSGWYIRMTSALPQWPKLYVSINFAQCYTYSYCPYIDTDDLQQMTPVCIISSAVVGIGTSTCKLRDMVSLGIIQLSLSIRL